MKGVPAGPVSAVCCVKPSHASGEGFALCCVKASDEGLAEGLELIRP